jgi:putative NADH-flavin reductase
VSTPTQPRSLALLGAGGNIGAKIRDEALARGHRVTGIARHIGDFPAVPGLRACSVDSHDREALGEVFRGHDAVLVAVRWNTNSIDDVLAAVRAARPERAVFIVGAGSLRTPDGRLVYDVNLERGLLAPTSQAALDAYREITAAHDLAWTAVSPSMSIEPGERTGRFRVGDDVLLVGSDGKSRISQEDFAVAVLDEIETPRHLRSRFTVGY